MLVATISPIGVGRRTPPANGSPPGRVWQATQSPRIFTYSPWLGAVSFAGAAPNAWLAASNMAPSTWQNRCFDTVLLIMYLSSAQASAAAAGWRARTGSGSMASTERSATATAVRVELQVPAVGNTPVPTRNR